jgi:RES domain-containing protein
MELLDRVFRISNLKHSEDLTGEGAYLFGGRWNSEGVRMLYTSESSSLSILEVLAYTSSSTLGKKVIVTIEIPSDSYREVDESTLDVGWDVVPSTDYTKKIGDAWIKSKESLALIVPSVINKREKNVLLNPLHHRFNEVKIVEKESFSFDKRLL